jgi:hypothetical protein
LVTASDEAVKISGISRMRMFLAEKFTSAGEAAPGSSVVIAALKRCAIQFDTKFRLIRAD